jgi:hypothetical protein
MRIDHHLDLFVLLQLNAIAFDRQFYPVSINYNVVIVNFKRLILGVFNRKQGRRILHDKVAVYRAVKRHHHFLFSGVSDRLAFDFKGLASQKHGSYKTSHKDQYQGSRDKNALLPGSQQRIKTARRFPPDRIYWVGVDLAHYCHA